MAARLGETVIMKGKPEKWAAESLVSKTESKAIASPEQQKKAGELTAEMLLMMTPIPGGKKLLDLAKKWYSSVFKGKGKAVKVSDKKLLELYQKAHPGAKVSKNMMSKEPTKVSKNMMSKKPAKVSENVLSNEKLLELYNKSHPRTSKPPAKKPTDKELSDLYKKAHPRTRGKQAKGGSVKKYARGGGVRKARF